MTTNVVHWRCDFD